LLGKEATRRLSPGIQSSEVWSVLGAVKTVFGKFGDVIAKMKGKLREASNTIGTVDASIHLTRSRSYVGNCLIFWLAASIR
jgi:DNA anti-recombination protein RmuC